MYLLQMTIQTTHYIFLFIKDPTVYARVCDFIIVT